MPPKQRGAGQTGGHGGDRANVRAFRNDGGHVPPPPSKPTISGDGKPGCGLFSLLIMVSPIATFFGMIYLRHAA